ncbi:MAG TPA: transaldolase [Bacteroidales bacterium]|nr:transaldolase [Bacteroidales bacterium]
MSVFTRQLHNQGVSIWLDNISRLMLDNGTFERYIDEFSVTGLTSNPTIFENAMANTNYYDDAIRALGNTQISDEDLFYELAVEDIQRAADLFLPVYQKTNGLDGFVSIEVSPLLAFDAENTIKAAKNIKMKVNRPNVLIKIPGTAQGLQAIEKVIAEGILVNITLIFSPEQYEAVTIAYLKGVETRIEYGYNPDIRSVASVFVSRWDKAVAGKVQTELQNKLGIAVMQKVYNSYNEFLKSDRVRRIMNFGAFPQRLLWASTGTKDAAISDIFYVKNLVAPFTINTMPENTLLAFAGHGESGKIISGSDEKADLILQQFKENQLDYRDLAKQLQNEGIELFAKSWRHLIESIAKKRTKLKQNHNL